MYSHKTWRIDALFHLLDKAMTRPDVANAVREVARQEHDPAPRHWKAALKIFQCVRWTRDMGLYFSNKRNDQLMVFADASFVDKNGDRRSVSVQ